MYKVNFDIDKIRYNLSLKEKVVYTGTQFSLKGHSKLLNYNS